MAVEELYQEVILDHCKSPRNFGVLASANRQANGHNPLCGDKVAVYIEVDDGVIRDISFEGAGCAISTASASLMTEAVKGRSPEEASRLFHRFHKLVTGEVTEPPENLGKLAALQGVCKYPIRVKCASLAWHTLQAALKASAETASTE